MQINNYIPVMVLGKSGHDISALVVKLKMKVPADMTMLQFVDRIRFRLKIPSFHFYHLLLEKGFAVMMSQNIGCVHQTNKDEAGLLRLTCILESTFGCIRPHPKRIRKLFPGSEPNPFGAPSPSFGFFTGLTTLDLVPTEGHGQVYTGQYSAFLASFMGQAPLNQIEGPQTVPNLSLPTISFLNALATPLTDTSLFSDHDPILLSDTHIPYLNPLGGQQTGHQGPSPQIPLQNQIISQQPVPRGPSPPVQFVNQVAVPLPPMPFISPVTGHQAGPRGPSLPIPIISQVGGQQTGPRAPLSKLNEVAGHQTGHTSAYQTVMNCLTSTDYLSQPESINASSLTSQEELLASNQTVMNCLTSTDYLSQPESINAASLTSQEELLAAQEELLASQLTQYCSEEDNWYFPPKPF